MTKLSDFLSNHLAEHDLDQKGCAAAFLAELERRAPEQRFELSTVTTKLSKLLAGVDEGEKFFFATPDRLAAFAAALDIEPERLTAMHEAWVLVLHPKLALDAVAYLLGRAEADDARYSVAQLPSATGDVCAMLRDLAQKSARSLVVLPDERDAPFFAGAKVMTSLLDAHPRGWTLRANPDLVPLPPPAPPAKWEGDSPLFPCDMLAEQVRQAWAQRATRLTSPSPFSPQRSPKERHDDVLERGEAPRFRLAEVERAHAEALREARIQLHDRTSTCDGVFDAWLGRETTTHVWSHGRTVFAVGPNVARARELLGGDACPHELVEPTCLAAWRVAIDTWNPWWVPAVKPSGGPIEGALSGPPDRWGELVRAAGNECGLDTRAWLDRWRAYTRGDDDRRVTSGEERRRSICVRGDAEDDVRATLRELASRELHVAQWMPSLGFRLRALAEAPLLSLEPLGRERFHVLAHLGGGHLLQVRAFLYPSEPPAPLRGDAQMLVAADVTLLMETSTDVVLEGADRVAARRRARERAAKEARAAHDDDDD